MPCCAASDGRGATCLVSSCEMPSGRSSLRAVLLGTVLLCMLQGLSAQDAQDSSSSQPSTCPAFPAQDTVVETAAGCEHAVEIPFTMKSHVASQTQIAILDVSIAAAARRSACLLPFLCNACS